MKKVFRDKKRTEIADFAHSDLRRLLVDYWTEDPHTRSLFESTVCKLKQMKFKMAAKVNSPRIRAFVSEDKHDKTLLETEIKETSQ
jgi:hypothetical protein